MSKGRKTEHSKDMNKKLALIGSGALVLLLVPALAAAQLGAPEQPPVVISDIGGVFGLIDKAIQWIFGILLVLAVIFLLYSAFLYLTSGGEDEKVKKAKGFLLYSIIAIVVALVARGIIALVRNFFVA